MFSLLFTAFDLLCFSGLLNGDSLRSLVSYLLIQFFYDCCDIDPISWNFNNFP